jgi:hypothetical protein
VHHRLPQTHTNREPKPSESAQSTAATSLREPCCPQHVDQLPQGANRSGNSTTVALCRLKPDQASRLTRIGALSTGRTIA